MEPEAPRRQQELEQQEPPAQEQQETPPRKITLELLGLLGTAAFYLAGEYAPDVPRLGGKFIQHWVAFPAFFVLGVIATKEVRQRIWARLNLEDRRYIVKVVSFGTVSTGLFAYLLGVLLSIPQPQPPGHGPLVGSLPLPVPPATIFPIPDKLPPPDTVEAKRPTKPPRVQPEPLARIPVQPPDDVIAQLPVIGVTEFAQAPYQQPTTPPPTVQQLFAAGPSNLRIVP